MHLDLDRLRASLQDLNPLKRFPPEIQAGFAVLAPVSDETLDNLLRLFGSLPEDELAETLESVARTSPKTDRRVMSAANRIARLSR